MVTKTINSGLRPSGFGGFYFCVVGYMLHIRERVVVAIIIVLSQF